MDPRSVGCSIAAEHDVDARVRQGQNVAVTEHEEDVRRGAGGAQILERVGGIVDDDDIAVCAGLFKGVGKSTATDVDDDAQWPKNVKSR